MILKVHRIPLLQFRYQYPPRFSQLPPREKRQILRKCKRAAVKRPRVWLSSGLYFLMATPATIYIGIHADEATRNLIAGVYSVSIFMLPQMLKVPIVTRCIRERVGGVCLDCGYDLTANTSGTCPECGNPVPVNLV